MKISAFMPVKNPEKRGDTYLEAIITHLYWADELIVVDGGSTDGSIEQIRKLQDSRIRIVTEPWPDEWSWKQFAITWNRGLQEATGDWVAAGESDHIFHEREAERVRDEVQRESNKGKGIIKCQKIQSSNWEWWQSKSQMYYWVYKAKYPQIRYGFDPNDETDLAHPIWWEGSQYEGIPVGRAIKEGRPHADLIGGTGAELWNYLWTFKTIDQVIEERLKAAKGWNKFTGFTEGYGRRFPETREEVEKWVNNQIRSVRHKAVHQRQLHQHPFIMRKKLEDELVPGMIGHELWTD